MPAKRSNKNGVRKGVYTISKSVTNCAQKLGGRGGRKTAAKKKAAAKKSRKKSPVRNRTPKAK